MGNKRKAEPLHPTWGPSLSPKKPKVLNIPADRARIKPKPGVLHWVESQSLSLKKINTADTYKHHHCVYARPELVIEQFSSTDRHRKARSCPELSFNRVRAFPEKNDDSQGKKSANGAVCRSLSPAPTRLTGQALREFNEANGYSNTFPSMPSSGQSKTTRSTGKSNETKEAKNTINAYDPKFAKCLSYRNIHLDDDILIEQASNFQELTEAITRPRSSSEADDKTARGYSQQARRAVNEKEFILNASPFLLPSPAILADEETELASDLRFSHNVVIDAKKGPKLTAPQPDRTVGWRASAFTSQEAIDGIETLGSYACPIPTKPDMTFPLFCTEEKGPKGGLETARLQSLSNGAHMLSNLLHLKQNSGKDSQVDPAFFKKVHVVTAEVTVDIIQLSCYWAVRGANGTIHFVGKVLHSWQPARPQEFKEAHRGLRNAMGWVKSKAFDWISKDLESVRTPPGLTPPSTASGASSSSS